MISTRFGCDATRRSFFERIRTQKDRDNGYHPGGSVEHGEGAAMFGDQGVSDLKDGRVVGAYRPR